jgi:hypothetical protein
MRLKKKRMNKLIFIHLFFLLSWEYFQADYGLINLVNPRKIAVEKDRLYISDDYMEINLYDDKFNKLKALYQEPGPDPNRLNLLQNNIDFDVTGSFIFITESKKGFVIEVFDNNGKNLYLIKKNYPKIKFQDWCKARIFDSKSKNPHSDQIKKKIVFPEYFPALYSFFIDNELMYVKTFEKEKDEFKFIILDINGNELKRTWLPEADIFTFKDGYYYWLVYEEKTVNINYAKQKQRYRF